MAVDGPAGSGKSSICHKVSERIGWTYVNTGAIYRAIGTLALEAGLSLEDPIGLVALIDKVAPLLRWDPAGRALWFGHRNLLVFE